MEHSIASGLIVESNDVNGLNEAVSHSEGWQIGCNGYGMEAVLTVTNVRQELAYFLSVILCLLGDLVSDAPHNDAGMVCISSYNGADILLCMLLKINIIAVRSLGDLPFVEELNDDHKAHLIAKPQQLRSGGIMCGSESVTAHLSELLHLPSCGGFVISRSKKSQIVMHTSSLELCIFSVEEKSLVGDKFSFSDTEAIAVAVKLLSRLAYERELQGVKRGRINAPELRRSEGHRKASALKTVLCHGVALAINDSRRNAGNVPRVFRSDSYISASVVAKLRLYSDSRVSKMCLITDQHSCGTEYAKSRIPAAAEGTNSAKDTDLVTLAKAYKLGNVKAEGKISVMVLPCKASVNENGRLIHNTVKFKEHVLFAVFLAYEHLFFINADANYRQAA